MSTIPTNSAAGSTGASSNTNTNLSNAISQSGFGNLSSNDFMQMLITELQNQDPTQPMSNQDLLTQLATMSQLQSTTNLNNALQSITTNQQLATAASFIGKTISGTDAQTNPVSGVVGQAFLQNGVAYVSVGNSQVPLSNVTAVLGAGTFSS